MLEIFSPEALAVYATAFTLVFAGQESGIYLKNGQIICPGLGQGRRGSPDAIGQ